MEAYGFLLLFGIRWYSRFEIIFRCERFLVCAVEYFHFFFGMQLHFWTFDITFALDQFQFTQARCNFLGAAILCEDDVEWWTLDSLCIEE